VDQHFGHDHSRRTTVVFAIPTPALSIDPAAIERHYATQSPESFIPSLWSTRRHGRDLSVARKRGLWVIEDARKRIWRSTRVNRSALLEAARLFLLSEPQNLGAMGDASAIVTNHR
jgi:hypothetical protein